MNERTVVQSEGGRPEVDELLREFFQAQMPQPWPALRLPNVPQARRVGSFWSRYAGRVALAACVALMVTGYLTLAGSFPEAPLSTGIETTVPEIGMKDRSKKTTPNRSTPPATEDHEGDRPTPMHLDNRPRKN